jgi:hypothetical protein
MMRLLAALLLAVLGLLSLYIAVDSSIAAVDKTGGWTMHLLLVDPVLALFTAILFVLIAFLVYKGGNQKRRI